MLQKLEPKLNIQISEVQEFSMNGKPGCVYVRTKRYKGESYGKNLRYVKGGSDFLLTSVVSVRSGKLTAQNKKEADRLFDEYLAELKTNVK